MKRPKNTPIQDWPLVPLTYEQSTEAKLANSVIVIGRTHVQRRRVRLVVDGDNLFLSRPRGVWINHSVLFPFARSFGELVEAVLYLSADPHNQPKQGYIKAMRRLGFTVIPRPHVTRHDGAHKSDVDAKLSWDMAKSALRNEMDLVILVSGDYSFYANLEDLQAWNIEVYVIGHEGHTSLNLQRRANRFWFAHEIEGLLTKERPNRKSSTSTPQADSVGGDVFAALASYRTPEEELLASLLEIELGL
ncbi:hypothetical protein SE17_03715 [Kouleothrix aurantiaca]|uniref:NYN domain-containing protein n=1 Tax=Kouleothrix aurantiaca TaxID=186479 RepID=A0A0P9FCK3_9CHLR|nr:hypothetical protein SE17_03715 [Kouleothrix aurantiaca]